MSLYWQMKHSKYWSTWEWWEASSDLSEFCHNLRLWSSPFFSRLLAPSFGSCSGELERLLKRDTVTKKCLGHRKRIDGRLMGGSDWFLEPLGDARDATGDDAAWLCYFNWKMEVQHKTGVKLGDFFIIPQKNRVLLILVKFFTNLISGIFEFCLLSVEFGDILYYLVAPGWPRYSCQRKLY